MQVGQVISGKYRLVRLLGDGGMGSVYEAHHEKLGTRVAIKFLHTELSRHSGLVERFLQEARVAAQIRSPYVVHVTDIDQTPEGAAYIVMDLLEGEPLSAVLEREHKVPVAVACEYTRQILEALEAAHALGVVHRDLKPENVFVTFLSGKPMLKLIDFGIAKLRQVGAGAAAQKNLTVAGVLMGTAEYMAPEQAFSADKVDARSDVYSVGVMLYEMIAGVRPVSGEDARVIASKVERGEVRPLVHAEPNVPREIAGLAHRAMAARPELRFSSAAEMRLALEGALQGKRPPTIPLAAPPPDLSKMAAGTGTVMGAPAQALLGANAHANGAAARPPHETAMGRGQPTPVGSAGSTGVPQRAPQPISPIHYGAPEHEPPRRSRAGAIIGIVLLGLVAVGAIVASQTDLLAGLFGGSSASGGDAPTATTPVRPPPVPTPPPGPGTGSAPAPTDSLAPLVTPKPPPVPGPNPNPTPPKPHPTGSASGTPDTPPVPQPFPIPFPSGLPPFPMPSGSAFPFPTTLPSFPIPLPNFGPPQVQPSPTPQPTASPGN
jgi:eukaryotic-like serine/threonine-protein kinase